MTIDEIREGIAISLDMHSLNHWHAILDDAQPGNYGIDDLEFQVSITDIRVDVRARTFTFKDGTLSFSARLLSSSDEDGVDMRFRKAVSGFGTFEFSGPRALEVTGLSLNHPLDLIEPDAVPV